MSRIPPTIFIYIPNLSLYISVLSMDSVNTIPDCVLLGSSAAVTCLAFARFSSNSDGSFIISGTQDGRVSCWSLKSRRVIITLNEAHENAILSIAPIRINKQPSFNELADAVLTQGRDGFVYVWRVLDNGLSWIKDGKILTQSLNFCRLSLTWSETQGILAIPSPSESTEINIYLTDDVLANIPKIKLKPNLGKLGLLMDLVISYRTSGSYGDHALVFGGFENGSIVIWIIKINKTETSLNLELTDILHENLHKETIMCLDFCHATNLGYSASADGLLNSWSVVEEECNGKLKFQIKLRICKHLTSGISCLRCRADGQLVALATWDSGLMLLGGKKLKILGELPLHEEPISCLCFNDHTKELAVGSQDKMISVWSPYSDV